MANVETRPHSRWWYGTVVAKGKRRLRNLDIAVAGIRPCPSYPDGDPDYQASRGRAEAKLDELRRESQQKARTVELLQAIHEARTGHRVGSLPLDKIAERWIARPRRRQPAATYVRWAQSVIKNFAAFIRATHPDKKEMSDINEDDALAFLSHTQERGVSARTWNAELILLRSAFKHLRKEAGMHENPFDDIPTKEDEPLHRRPFTPDDLQAILRAAQTDDLVRPLVVTGMCTAMRLGDVCTLKWADVDMRSRFITVKTGKTGAKVSIPMFPMLYDALAALPCASHDVFPEAAAIYRTRPDVINRRLQSVFAAAGFYDRDTNARRLTLPDLPENWHATAKAAIRAADLKEKRKAQLLRALELYTAGQTIPAIAAATGICKGTVSNHLRQVEELAGFAIVRQLAPPPPPSVPHRDDMCITRENGLRKTNVHGFHSFRTTWVTLALTAGVPLDLVRKVTGHRTADIVLANYFQPGREQFRQVLQAKMPALLSNGTRNPKDEAIAVLRAAKAKTWRKDVERALELLSSL